MTSESDQIISLYQRKADNWDADRGRSLFEKPWLDRLLALVPARASVLDLGCGSGEPIARYLIESGHDVVGVDSSPPLIALSAERFPQHTWAVADMRTLDLVRRFDAIIAWDSFFHLTPDDQRRMFPVFARHIAARGALMFTSGPAHGEVIGSFHGEPLYHASLDPAEYRALLDEAGFDVVAHVAEDPTCGGHTIWLARQRV
jgi:trans-aconitate methyltransferase